MTVFLGDPFELRLSYKYEDQVMNNVFFYDYRNLIDPFGTPHSQLIAELWEAQVFPAVRTMFPTQVSFSDLSVRCLVDEDDAYELPLAVAGLAAWADRLPRHDTVNFTLNGEYKRTRKGAKRIGIFNESVVTNGVISFPSQIANCTNVAVKLALPLTTSFLFTQNTYYPVIVKRVKEGTAPNVTYRLPTVRSEVVLNTIVTAMFSVLMSTQNTRKR